MFDGSFTRVVPYLVNHRSHHPSIELQCKIHFSHNNNDSSLTPILSYQPRGSMPGSLSRNKFKKNTCSMLGSLNIKLLIRGAPSNQS